MVVASTLARLIPRSRIEPGQELVFVHDPGNPYLRVATSVSNSHLFARSPRASSHCLDLHAACGGGRRGLINITTRVEEKDLLSKLHRECSAVIDIRPFSFWLFCQSLISSSSLLSGRG